MRFYILYHAKRENLFLGNSVLYITFSFHIMQSIISFIVGVPLGRINIFPIDYYKILLASYQKQFYWCIFIFISTFILLFFAFLSTNKIYFKVIEKKLRNEESFLHFSYNFNDSFMGLFFGVSCKLSTYT